MHNGTQIVQHRSGTLTRHKERAPVFVPRLLESPPCSRSTTRGSLMPSNGAVPSPAAAHIRWPRCVLSHRRLPDACSAGTATAPARRRRAAAAAARRRAEEERRSAVSGEPADPPRSGAEVGLGSAESACGAGRLAWAWRGSRQCKRGVSGHEFWRGMGGLRLAGLARCSPLG